MMIPRVAVSVLALNVMLGGVMMSPLPASAQLFGPSDEDRAREAAQDNGIEELRGASQQQDSRVRSLEDKVQALDLGADDYVTKPFGPEELLARVRVALRRRASVAEGADTGTVTVGTLAIDYDRRRVIRDGEEIRLTPRELELLSLLARNHDRVLTSRALLKAIWGANAVEQPEHLWTLVAQLRRKIEEDPANPRHLVSEPWVGYRLVTQPPPRG